MKHNKAIQQVATQKIIGTEDSDVDLKIVKQGSENRKGLWILALGLVCFIGWAALAPLDEGVPALAKVSTAEGSAPIQFLGSGIIRSVHVTEGDTVKKGQLLAEIESENRQAEFQADQQNYFGTLIKQARIKSEIENYNSIQFPTLPPEIAANAQLQELMSAELSVFNSRKTALLTQLQTVEASIKGQQESISSYREMIRHKELQLKSTQEELQSFRELVSQGFAPKNRQLQMEQNISTIQVALSETLGNIRRSQSSILELENRKKSLIQENRKALFSELTDIDRQVKVLHDKYKASEAELSRTKIISPVDGEVVGLKFTTPGAVVQSGQKLMDIAPENQPLLIDAQVPPTLIDRISKGQEVDIRLSSFRNTPSLTVKGYVESISASPLTEERTGQSFFLARVKVSSDGIKKIGPRKIQPGMVAEVIFKTGERSLLTYLWSPLAKRVAASMTEE